MFLKRQKNGKNGSDIFRSSRGSSHIFIFYKIYQLFIPRVAPAGYSTRMRDHRAPATQRIIQ